MRLLAETPKPDAPYARTLQEFAEANGLPPRVIGAIEDYIEDAEEAATIAQQLKDAQGEASNSWKNVRDQAGRTNDLVDMAEEVSSRPANAERVKTPEFAEGKTAFHDGVEFLSSPYPIGSEKHVCWSLGYMSEEYRREAEDDAEATADRVEKLLNDIPPPSLDFYAGTDNSPGFGDIRRNTLARLPDFTNDPDAPDLTKLVRAIKVFHDQGMAGDPATKPLIIEVLTEWFGRLADTGKRTDDVRLHAAGAALCPIETARALLTALDPAALDTLDPTIPLDSENVSPAAMSLALSFGRHLCPGLSSTVRLAIIEHELGQRTAKKPRKKKSGKTATPDPEPESDPPDPSATPDPSNP